MQTNEYLNPLLESLVKKVHDEGVEKGNEEAKKIITAAEQQSAEMLKKAGEQIAQLKEQSLNETNRLRESVISELKAAAQQTVSSIKNELAAIIINMITLPEINPALHEKEFLQNMISTVLQKWDPGNTNTRFELLLNKDDEAQLRGLFEQEIKQKLAIEVEIVVENRIKSGFKIGVKNENYYVSFTDDDFEHLFKGYLHKKTLESVYGVK